MGLLSRASNLDENPKLAFSDFILKYHLKTCAVLEKDQIYYSLTNSIGFDANTVISISSTPAFWQGLCNIEGMVYHFQNKDNSLSPLLQLFSFNMKDQISDLYVCRGINSKILISFEELSPEAARDFEKVSNENHKCNLQKLNPYIKEDSVLLKFNIDCSKSIYAFLTQENINENQTKIAQSIFKEFYNRMVCFFNKVDATAVFDGYSLKTVFICDKTYSQTLIEKHLKLNLQVITKQPSDLIKIDFLGKADSYNDIKQFLQAE